MKFFKVKKIILAAMLFYSPLHYAYADVICKTPESEWEEKYNKVKMDRVPSMFDECNPFSDLFSSDFFGDFLGALKEKLGNVDLFCGYGTDDVFSDVSTVYGSGSSSTPTSILSGVEDKVNGTTKSALDEAVGSMTNPLIPGASISSSGSSNSTSYNMVFK